MILWRHRDGDKRFTFKWFTKNDYIEHFGEKTKTHKIG